MSGHTSPTSLLLWGERKRWEIVSEVQEAASLKQIAVQQSTLRQGTGQELTWELSSDFYTHNDGGDDNNNSKSNK